MEPDETFSRFNRNPPVSNSEIEQFEANIGFELPKDYAEFLQWSNGGEGSIGAHGYARFWRLEELVEWNKAYEVAEFAPGLFVFGSDGGGEAYAFDTRTAPMSIVEVTFVSMGLDDTLFMAPTFSDSLVVLSKLD